ncbi:MAG TPA: hypothetical protein VIQ30_20565 [Pseudonocardia sp.]
MTSRHQITAHVLADPDQVAGGFLLHTRYRDRDRDDLAEVQQPGQMLSVTLVCPDLIPDGALLLRRSRHL